MSLTEESATNYTMEKEEYRKNYNRNYYQKYKNIIANKRSYCDCCQLEFAAWNIYKHNKSKKHLFNSMSEEDKKKKLEEKTKEKINNKIEKLKALL